jgi:hypothetical protein
MINPYPKCLVHPKQHNQPTPLTVVYEFFLSFSYKVVWFRHMWFFTMMHHGMLILLHASFLLAHKSIVKVCHYVFHEKCHDNFLELSCGDSFRIIVLKLFKDFENVSMKCFPHYMFLQPLTSTWLRVAHSKVWGDKAQMMCGITCLRGFG